MLVVSVDINGAYAIFVYINMKVSGSLMKVHPQTPMKFGTHRHRRPGQLRIFSEREFTTWPCWSWALSLSDQRKRLPANMFSPSLFVQADGRAVD